MKLVKYSKSERKDWVKEEFGDEFNLRATHVPSFLGDDSTICGLAIGEYLDQKDFVEAKKPTCPDCLTVIRGCKKIPLIILLLVIALSCGAPKQSYRLEMVNDLGTTEVMMELDSDSLALALGERIFEDMRSGNPTAGFSGYRVYNEAGSIIQAAGVWRTSEIK